MLLWREKIPFERRVSVTCKTCWRQTCEQTLSGISSQRTITCESQRNPPKRLSPVSASSSRLPPFCPSSCTLRKAWGRCRTCTPSTSHRSLAASSYCFNHIEFSSEKNQPSSLVLTVLLCSNSHLLSWICPSTLCRSFPNIPHGLKFKMHLSPVLKGNSMSTQ